MTNLNEYTDEELEISGMSELPDVRELMEEIE